MSCQNNPSDLFCYCTEPAEMESSQSAFTVNVLAWVRMVLWDWSISLHVFSREMIIAFGEDSCQTEKRVWKKSFIVSYSTDIQCKSKNNTFSFLCNILYMQTRFSLGDLNPFSICFFRYSLADGRPVASSLQKICNALKSSIIHF